MFPILVFAVAFWLGLLADSAAQMNREVAQMYQARARSMKTVALAENLEQFYQERNVFPASTAALAASAGFQQARSLVEPWQGYAVSPVLTDGVWQFSRAVLFSNTRTAGVTAAAYLASNACGTGGYDTAVSWCGRKQSDWFRRETKESFNQKIGTQRARMGRLLQKLADYYNLNKKFPDKDNLSVPLAADSINKIATLVGYAGTAGNCSGVFNYMDVPIDCADMFDIFGGHIGYQFVSGKRVILVSESPIFNAAGNRVVVAAELDNSAL